MRLVTLNRQEKIKRATYLYEHTSKSVSEICKEVGIARSTFYRNKPREVKKRGHLNKGRKYTFNLKKFLTPSPSWAYWLGFISADGSVVNNSLSIELSSIDRGHLEKFVSWSETTSPIVERSFSDGRSSSKVSIHSKELVDLLAKYSIVQNKSEAVRVPDAVPGNLVSHFLRGYFDGDGTISFTKGGQLYFSVVSASYAIMKDFQREFSALSGNRIIDYKTYYKLTVTGNKKALSLFNLIYEGSDESNRLERKYKTYLTKKV